MISFLTACLVVLQNKFPQFTIQVTSSKLQSYKLRYLHINFSVRLNKSALWHDKTHFSWNWTKNINPLLFYDEIWTIYFAIKLFEFVAPYSMFSFIENFCKVNSCKKNFLNEEVCIILCCESSKPYHTNRTMEVLLKF